MQMSVTSYTMTTMMFCTTVTENIWYMKSTVATIIVCTTEHHDDCVQHIVANNVVNTVFI